LPAQLKQALPDMVGIQREKRLVESFDPGIHGNIGNIGCPVAVFAGERKEEE